VAETTSQRARRLGSANTAGAPLAWYAGLIRLGAQRAGLSARLERGQAEEETNAQTMKPRVTVITLGVANLEAALTFYRDGLGLPTRGIVGAEFEHGALALFDLQHGLKLAIYPRSDLAFDAKVALGLPSATECTVGHYLRSREEVDAVMAQAELAGATISDAAHDRPWGIYSGYFQDPDGHVWEVVWDPRMEADIID
jgi:uncharacterized protein